MDIFDFRDQLKDEWDRRRGRNSSYSLRSYSRDLGITAANLSEILSGKKGLSPQAAEAIVAKMNLPAFEHTLFLLSVAAQHSRSSVAKKLARKKLNLLMKEKFQQAPKHSTVVHWTTEATLKLSERIDFIPDASFLSQILGLPSYMGYGLNYLTRAGLLPGVSPEKAYLAKRHKGKRLNIDFEQILELGRKVFLSTTLTSKLFEHEPLLIEPKDFPSVQNIIANTYQEIKKLESKSKSAKLYYFTTQFFCVEQERKNK